jgi:hypothetical protein
MSTRKTLAFLAVISLAALAACTDVTGPQPNGADETCAITGGPGTCPK